MQKNSKLHLVLGGTVLRRCAPPTVVTVASTARERILPRLAVSLLAIILLAIMLSTNALAESTDAYKARCSACHGANGAGETMLGKNLKLRALSSPEVQKQSDEELFTIISKGKSRMPSFDNKLSRDQIRELVKHIRSLKK